MSCAIEKDCLDTPATLHVRHPAGHRCFEMPQVRSPSSAFSHTQPCGQGRFSNVNNDYTYLGYLTSLQKQEGYHSRQSITRQSTFSRLAAEPTHHDQSTAISPSMPTETSSFTNLPTSIPPSLSLPPLKSSSSQT